MVRFPEALAVPEWVSCMLLGQATQPVCLRSTETLGKREVELVLSVPPGEWRLVIDCGGGRRRESMVSMSGSEIGATLLVSF